MFDPLSDQSLVIDIDIDMCKKVWKMKRWPPKTDILTLKHTRVIRAIAASSRRCFCVLLGNEDAGQYLMPDDMRRVMYETTNVCKEMQEPTFQSVSLFRFSVCH